MVLSQTPTKDARRLHCVRIEADQHKGLVSDDPLNDRLFTIAYSNMIWPKMCDRAREILRKEKLTLWTEHVSPNTVLSEFRVLNRRAFCVKPV